MHMILRGFYEGQNRKPLQHNLKAVLFQNFSLMEKIFKLGRHNHRFGRQGNINSVYLTALCLKCGTGIQPNFNPVTNMLCMFKATTTQGC